MKAFVSWSGGKDCLYALHNLYKSQGGTPSEEVTLLNMVSEDGEKSRSHGIDTRAVSAQAEALGLPLLQVPIEGKYEASFKGAIHRLQEEKGVDTGIFGDIYLQVHRDWIERVASEIGIRPLFPLWGRSPAELVRAFVADGFKTRIVAVRKGMPAVPFLGRDVDEAFVEEASHLRMDLCGEEGEYHTFVYDGPLFRHPVSFKVGEKWEDEKHFFLPVLV